MEFYEKPYYDLIAALLFMILCVFIIIACVIGDFYDDYKCSTTTDWEYWESHNCIRYCKECKNEKDNR